MSTYTEELDDVNYYSPVLAQKGVKLKITSAEHAEWEVKDKEKWTSAQRAAMEGRLGEKYDVCKLTFLIEDDSVKTEGENAIPRLDFDHSFNIQKYPYPNSEGKQVWMGRQYLYQLEEAFGFEPVYMVAGVQVEPHVTKNGKKVAPKAAGVQRAINPTFFEAYFTPDGHPNVDAWVDKTVYADIKVEKSAQFGDRNKIGRYVKAPEI